MVDSQSSRDTPHKKRVARQGVLLKPQHATNLVCLPRCGTSTSLIYGQIDATHRRCLCLPFLYIVRPCIGISILERIIILKWCGYAEEPEPATERLLEFAEHFWKNQAFRQMTFGLYCPPNAFCEESPVRLGDGYFSWTRRKL